MFLPVVSIMYQLSSELVLSVECRHVDVAVDAGAYYNGVETLSSQCIIITRAVVIAVGLLPRRQSPASFTSITRLLRLHAHYFHLVPDVLLQLEVIGVHANVLQELGVVQVVREIARHGKVAETHRFFRGVSNR